MKCLFPGGTMPLFALFFLSVLSINAQAVDVITTVLRPGTTHDSSNGRVTITSDRGVAFDRINDEPNWQAFYWFDDGFYSVNSDPVHEYHSAGSYTPSLRTAADGYDVTIPSFLINTDPVVIEGSIIGSSTSRPGLGANGVINLGTSWPMTGGKNLILIIPFTNPQNSTVTSGSLDLELPHGVDVVKVLEPNASSYAGQNWATQHSTVALTNGATKVQWDFLDLLPGEVRIYYVEVDISIELADKEVSFEANLNGCQNDSFQATNDECQSVVRSFRALPPRDPNYIKVDKDMISSEGSSQVLTYDVGFLNDGDWFVEDVYVDVTFSQQQDFDLSTVKLLETSAPCTISRLSDKVLRFQFENIYLPGVNQSVCHEVFEADPSAPPCEVVYLPNETRADFRFSLNTGGSLSPGNYLLASADINFVGTSIITADPPAKTMVSIEDAPKGVYPNPFTNEFVIPYLNDSALETAVAINLYDITGREIALIYQGAQVPGIQQYIYDARHLPAGTYVVQIQAGDYRRTQKIVKI